MSNSFRKIKRNKLKSLYKTNKINEIYHDENDTIEQRMLRYIKKENEFKNKK